MSSLPSLKENRAITVDALRAIVAAAAAQARDLSEQEQAAFDAGKAEVEKLERDIRNGEFLAEAERRVHGEPVASNGGDKAFETECREFSLVKAIRAQMPGCDVDVSRELEVSRELQRRAGAPAQGMLVPTAVFEKRVVTTGLPAPGPGSNVIATDWRGDMFIDRLRAAMAVRRLGATVLSGLVGNVDIPRLKASATSAWVAENAAITASDPQFDKVSLTPKHCGVMTEVSRNMVLQSSPDIEEILRNDFAALLATALDAAAIKGGGTNEPVGILSTAGVGNVAGAGGNGLAPSWANIVALIGTVGAANGLQGSLAFLTNSNVVAKLSTVLRSTADTSSSFILADPGTPTLAGYPLGVSNNVPNNLTSGTGTNLSALIFGNFADLLIGYWSAFDLLVNPYETTAYSKGNVLIRGMMTTDIKLRHPESFAKTADLITT